MDYKEFVKLYDELSATSKRLQKIQILSEFLRKLREDGESEWSYLLRARVFPDYDSREFGISKQLAIKFISFSFGVKTEEVVSKFNKIGDLGEVAEYFVQKRRQSALFSNKLTVKKVFENLRKINEVEGKGAVEKKMQMMSEILTSADGKEAKYIVRTTLGELRIGVADAIIIEAINAAFFSGDESTKEIIESKYDLVNDIALIFDAAAKGKKELEKISIVPGRPIKAMLAIKVDSIDEAFRICGAPAAIEYKYDGFRMFINKKGKEISLFTRKLENVTSQFPDVVEAVRKNVKGADFILDSEIVGYDLKSKKYQPFEAISQRIKRKYDIDRLIKELPVEINVFDIVFYNGKSLIERRFIERRKILEKAVSLRPFVIRPSIQIITGDAKAAEKFYEEALKSGEEGIMIKKIDAQYKQGRRVGYMVKIKPNIADLDLVITGAEYGTGKRAGWLTSYTVACIKGDEFLDVGMVSSGLKEKKEEGTSYDEMTKLLKPLVTDEMGNKVRIKPQIVVSVIYQNIQKSPSYSSGYALRFPRITAYRPDRNTRDIASLSDIEKEASKGRERKLF